MTDGNSGRNADGTPLPAVGPGKPLGARHKATQAALAMLDAQSEALTPARLKSSRVWCRR
ncbi:MAG: hypothetical protein Q7J57_16685 [Gemmobacter sp.]|nr:hypothetical protein [Gemmobacter sp.]